MLTHFSDLFDHIQVPCWKMFCGFCIILVGFFQAYCSASRWVKIHECHERIMNTTHNSSEVYDSYYNFTATLYGLFAVLHASAALQILIDSPCKSFNLKNEFKKVFEDIKTLKLECRFLISFVVIIILFLLSIAVIVTGLLYDLKYRHCSYNA